MMLPIVQKTHATEHQRKSERFQRLRGRRNVDRILKLVLIGQDVGKMCQDHVIIFLECTFRKLLFCGAGMLFFQAILIRRNFEKNFVSSDQLV